MQKRKSQIVVIGGGTGSFTILRGLKQHTDNLTAIVNMADDGGSTGVLRDQLGVLPPGDIRQCLVAMSNSSEQLRQLFNFRFPAGSDFAGHSVGNLFLSATELMTNNFAEAVAMAGEVLQIHGKVMPITLDNRQMVLTTADGTSIVGQYAAETHHVASLKGSTISYDKPARVNPEALLAIRQADLIVLAPGNLYASLIPALAVKGVSKALGKSKAKIAYVCNLVNKPHHTVDYMVDDYVSELEKYTDNRKIDYVLYNTDKPSKLTLKAYALEGEYPVEFNAASSKSYKAIGGRFLSHQKLKRDKNDRFILRSLIRHDGEAIGRALMELTNS